MEIKGPAGKGGFSLVEVCLAVLVVGLGLLSVFSLFPTGLAASEAANADTDMSLFAQKAFSGIQARATEVAWNEWEQDDLFSGLNLVFTKGTRTVGADYPPTVAYVFDIANGGSPRIKNVTLTVLPWKAPTLPPLTLVDSKGMKFYTEVYYMELP